MHLKYVLPHTPPFNPFSIWYGLVLGETESFRGKFRWALIPSLTLADLEI